MSQSPRRLRLVAASVFAAAAILGAGIDRPPDSATAWVLLGAAFVAAGLMWVPRLEAQLLSRSILWAYLFWATLGSLLIDDTGRVTRLLLSVGVGTAGALFALPSDGLDEAPVSKRFDPVGFRSVLLLIVLLAMTDALVLGTNLLAYTEDHWVLSPWTIAFFAGGSAAMTAAVIGLLRMRTWGFALNLVTNVAVASIAWGVDDLPWELALGLTSTAVLQIVVGLPLAFRIASPGAADPSPLYRRAGRYALGGLVVVLVGGRVAYAL